MHQLNQCLQHIHLCWCSDQGSNSRAVRTTRRLIHRNQPVRKVCWKLRLLMWTMQMLCVQKYWNAPKAACRAVFSGFFIAFFIMKKGYWNNLKTPELNTKIIFLRKCALYCPAVLSESKGYYCQIITIIKILCHWTPQNDSWFAAIDKNSFDCRNGASGLPLIEFKTVVMWGKIW